MAGMLTALDMFACLPMFGGVQVIIQRPDDPKAHDFKLCLALHLVQSTPNDRVFYYDELLDCCKHLIRLNEPRQLFFIRGSDKPGWQKVAYMDALRTRAWAVLEYELKPRTQPKPDKYEEVFLRYRHGVLCDLEAALRIDPQNLPVLEQQVRTYKMWIDWGGSDHFSQIMTQRCACMV